MRPINFSIKISEARPTLINLRDAGKGMTRVFKDAIKQEMVGMRDLARTKLEEASLARTGKKYWTGTLQSSIKDEVIKDSPGQIEGAVGVDLTVVAQTPLGRRIVKDYDVAVEKGHAVGFGGLFWEGYHFVEGAYTELAPGMIGRLGKVISKVVAAKTSYGTGWRNVATGQYAGAPK